MMTSAPGEYQLEPRYRRILSFGDVLDESVGLFRRHWSIFALISAIWLLPPSLLSVLVAGSGAFDTSSLVTQIEAGEEGDLSSLGGFAGLFALTYLVSVLFYVGWAVAVLVTTDDYLHAVEPRLKGVLARTMRRLLPSLISGLTFGLVLVLLLGVAGLIFALFVIALPVSLLAILAAIAGGVVWAFQPRARSTWLKWLIVIATPFGLPIYMAGAWSMYLCAVVLEGRGPLRALRRSTLLVDRHWFRVMGILVVAAMVVSIVVSVPTLLVQVPLTISAALRGEVGLSGAELAVSTAVGRLAEILFASMSSIVYVMVFVDLRNRREGTDLAERLSRLESESVTPPLPVVDG